MDPRLNQPVKLKESSVLISFAVISTGFLIFVGHALISGEITMGGSALPSTVISKSTDPQNFWISVIGLSWVPVLVWVYIFLKIIRRCFSRSE